MSQPIAALMQKEMSRREFLLTLGLAVASIMGFSTIIRMVTGHSLDSRLTQHSSLGFGSGSYGGGSDR